MAKRITPKETTEERRFEVLLEDIRGQLKLVCEAQSASVQRDERLEARIDRLGTRLDVKIDRMHKEFYELVKNVHADLKGEIKSVENRLQSQIGAVETHLQVQIDSLRKDVQEVKEILITHDKRISTLEHIPG